MKTHSKKLALALLALALAASARAQVNSGSTGADGAFNPTTNTVINMADHPDGIYHFTSVNIPSGVAVTFIPNANNTPVVWLVQGNCTIDGTVDASGESAADPSTGKFTGGRGGPGGFRGGNGGVAGNGGQGPGGGLAQDYRGRDAGYGARPIVRNSSSEIETDGGPIYGNQYVLPLNGGSGGGGSTNINNTNGGGAGGGGGGAILIAVTQTLDLKGSIVSNGGAGGLNYVIFIGGGGGSGGAIRLISSKLTGTGSVQTLGGSGASGTGGVGRVRFDVWDNNFGGSIYGVSSQGFQPVIIPTAGQGTQLAIASVAGAPVAASPNGQLATPDSMIAAQASNPVAIVVRCTNLPLNTPVTVTVKPANGAAISAVGYNNTGTLASSTATVSLNMPRGGGLIYATAATAP